MVVGIARIAPGPFLSGDRGPPRSVLPQSSTFLRLLGGAAAWTEDGWFYAEGETSS